MTSSEYRDKLLTIRSSSMQVRLHHTSFSGQGDALDSSGEQSLDTLTSGRLLTTSGLLTRTQPDVPLDSTTRCHDAAMSYNNE